MLPFGNGKVERQQRLRIRTTSQRSPCPRSSNQRLCQKVGMPVVRGADDVKIAQRFIAGVQSGRRISPRSGRMKMDTIMAEKNRSSRESFNLSRPFHGLSCK